MKKQFPILFDPDINNSNESYPSPLTSAFSPILPSFNQVLPESVIASKSPELAYDLLRKRDIERYQLTQLTEEYKTIRSLSQNCTNALNHEIHANPEKQEHGSSVVVKERGFIFEKVKYRIICKTWSK